MTRWFRDTEAALGRNPMIAAFAAIAAGLAGFATGLGEAERPRTFAALIASWLFFAGLTAGAVAFRALFQIIAARWTRPLVELGTAFLGFVPVALAVLAVIVIGSSAWLHAAPGSTWMSGTVLSIRELVLAAALFGGASLLRPAAERAGRPVGVLATIYLIVFAIVVSIWAFDLVLGSDATFESTLIGGFVFTSAFTASTGLIVWLGVRHGLLAERERRDAGALLLALAIFWAYLFWAQYLTIWYGNLPDEVTFALRRATGGWGIVVLAVIALVFAGPFVVLLHPAGRRSARVLGTVLALQLFGYWLCCDLLIVPSLTPGDAPVVAIRDALVALGMLGAFALSVARGLKTSLPERKIV
jgi:hypothetical protein